MKMYLNSHFKLRYSRVYYCLLLVDINFLALTAYPLHLCMQVGTTSSTAVDPLPALANIAKVIYLIELVI